VTLTTGGNLGLLINGAQGDLHYNELMARWRGIDGLCQPVAKTTNSLTSPGSPANGDVHIVARGYTQLDLTWTRSGSTITLAWEAHGLTVGRTFRIVTSSSTGAVALTDYTVASVPGVDSITFTGLSGGATSGTLSLFALPYGTWAGKVDQIARYKTTGTPGWEYYTPKKGWQMGAADLDTPMFYGGTGTTEGWRRTIGTLLNNTRGSRGLDLAGESVYTLPAEEARFCALYVFGARD